MITVSCGQCKCEFGMPNELYHAAQRSSLISWWCPYGHQRHFVEGESEEQKLRRELQRVQQQIAYKDDQITDQRKTIIAMKGQATKLKKRVHAGVCPCCSRSFTNLRRHMATKHPDYGNVVPLEPQKDSA